MCLALRASGLWLRYAALQNLIPSFPWIARAPTPSTLAQSKERKGSNFVIWQPWLQDEVQISYNQFETGKKLVGMAPLILYSLVAGALSDRYGRKPIFIVALFGRMFEGAVEFVFYVFKDDISVYFWYCTAIFEFLGGMPMYYLGKVL